MKSPTEVIEECKEILHLTPSHLLHRLAVVLTAEELEAIEDGMYGPEIIQHDPDGRNYIAGIPINMGKG